MVLITFKLLCSNVSPSADTNLSGIRQLLQAESLTPGDQNPMEYAGTITTKHGEAWRRVLLSSCQDCFDLKLLPEADSVP